MKNAISVIILLFAMDSTPENLNRNYVSMPEVINSKVRNSYSISKNYSIVKSKIKTAFETLTGKGINSDSKNNVRFQDIELERNRRIINIPDIHGYKTLKCDFHMHTVFSDGIVWPTYRVDEAWVDGLDAIAITDHIEKNPSKKFIGGDDNSSYELALPRARQKNILLIKGGEITRDMPPGHFNALFLNNVNAVDKPDFRDAFSEAKKQGAYFIWNHPGWKAQQPDTCKWWDQHTELFNKGMLHAIEVFNENEHYPVTLDWCNEKDIAYTAASDIHGIVSETFDLETYHRPMTLVLAKERSLESIRDALFANRTVAWFGNFLAGKEEYLKAFFESSVKTSYLGENKNGKEYLVRNISDVPFHLRSDKTDITIPAISETIITISLNENSMFEVVNLLIKSNKKLTILFPDLKSE